MFKCEICGKEYVTIAERAACESKCVENLLAKERDAGVEKYHAKKRELEAKVSIAKKNLTAANDELNELVKNYSELKFGNHTDQCQPRPMPHNTDDNYEDGINDELNEDIEAINNILRDLFGANGLGVGFIVK